MACCPGQLKQLLPWLFAATSHMERNIIAGVEFHGPDAPILQQDVLAALAASGTEFWLSQASRECLPCAHEISWLRQSLTL